MCISFEIRRIMQLLEIATSVQEKHHLLEATFARSFVIHHDLYIGFLISLEDILDRMCDVYERMIRMYMTRLRKSINLDLLHNTCIFFLSQDRFPSAIFPAIFLEKMFIKWNKIKRQHDGSRCNFINLKLICTYHVFRK